MLNKYRNKKVEKKFAYFLEVKKKAVPLHPQSNESCLTDFLNCIC